MPRNLMASKKRAKYKDATGLMHCNCGCSSMVEQQPSKMVDLQILSITLEHLWHLFGTAQGGTGASCVWTANGEALGTWTRRRARRDDGGHRPGRRPRREIAGGVSPDEDA